MAIQLNTIDELTVTRMYDQIEKTTFLGTKFNKQFDGVLNELLSLFGKKYRTELKVIVSHSSQAIRYGSKGFLVSRDKNVYASANKLMKRVGANAIGHGKMMTLLNMMENEGLIVNYIGCQSKNKSKRSRSFVVMKGLVNIFDKVACDVHGTERPEKDLQEIKVVDIETREKKYSVNQKKNITTKEFKELKGRAAVGLKEVKSNLFKYNKLIERNVITVEDKFISNIVYFRQFEGDLKGCGRYYSNFSSLKSDLRKEIKINNNPVCEIDYKNCAPRILAAMNNVDLGVDFDAYKIEGLERDFSKGLLFPCLFGSDRRYAKGSVTKLINEAGIKGMTGEEVLAKFEEHNSYMKDKFFSESLYRELQNKDSQMASYIINYFTAKGIVVLCYHDSFVVEQQYQDELLNVMYDAWEHVLGTTASCCPTIEFNQDEEVSEKKEEEVLVVIQENEESQMMSAYAEYSNMGEIEEERDEFLSSIGFYDEQDELVQGLIEYNNGLGNFDLY